MSDDYSFRSGNKADAHRRYVNNLAAAEGGDEYAMEDLGVMFAAGDGVPQDYDEARRWFEKAAAAGSHDAMTHLAVLYANGWGVRHDYSEARQWLEKAVALGNDDAMYRLGELYRKGLGVSPDPREARRLYEQAADAGNGDAMFELGRLYLMRSGVPEDVDQGRGWIERAAAAGNANAKKIMQDLSARQARFAKQDPPSQKGGGCFIATAACGSALEPEVKTLQAFRDCVLRKHALGRLFIQGYESVSPPIARWIGRRPVARFFVRLVVVIPCAALSRRLSRGQY